jgi:hypothetical protein
MIMQELQTGASLDNLIVNFVTEHPFLRSISYLNGGSSQQQNTATKLEAGSGKQEC